MPSGFFCRPERAQRVEGPTSPLPGAILQPGTGRRGRRPLQSALRNGLILRMEFVGKRILRLRVLYELRYACPRQAYSFKIRCAAHHAQDDREMGKAGSSACHSEQAEGASKNPHFGFAYGIRVNPSVTPDGVTAPFTQGSLGRIEFGEKRILRLRCFAARSG